MYLNFLRKITLLGVSFIFLLGSFIVLFYALTPLPEINVGTIASKQSIILEDRNGVFLFDFSKNERRTFVPIEDIGENIKKATIAIEDHLFFEHNGIRIDSLIRAFIKNIQTQSFSQGGSTITQQVIKNVFLTTEKNIERKMKEFLLSSKLENELSKDEILEIYLNTIPYGGVVYGIGEASNTFFGKTPSDLTIAESAYLAAIPNAPTFFSPHGNNKTALEQRKNIVLSLMLEHNLISKEEYSEARNEYVHFREPNSFSIQAPHFVFFVRDLLERRYGASLKPLEGKKVQTTLDLELQNEVEDIIKKASPEFTSRFNGNNMAAVILSSKGDILSMVGSRDFFEKEIDGGVNIITSLRQPGSTFKPISYAQAFEKGLQPETIVYDAQTQFNSLCDMDKLETSEEENCYAPVNYSGNFSGPVSLRNALAQSINIPAIKVLYIAGLRDVIKLAERMGIKSIKNNPEQYGLSLGLGSVELTPLELAQAYNVFANDGLFVPYTWELQEKKQDGDRVLEKNTARNITNILKDDNARAPLFGFNSPLKITSPEVAVKTGTTNNSRDVWVVGYSPDIVVVLWGGNSDGEVLESDASGFSLSNTFKEIMLIASKKYSTGSSYFPTTNSEQHLGADILFGIQDRRKPHNILHYITKNDIYEQPKSPEDDPQYENWEFGVQNWIDEHEEDIDKKNNVTDNDRFQFSILSPRKEKEFIRKKR